MSAPLLELPDSVMGLAERVAELCDQHRAHYERRFADQLLTVLSKLHDECEPSPGRDAYAAVIRLVKAMGGAES